MKEESKYIAVLKKSERFGKFSFLKNLGVLAVDFMKHK